MNPTEQNTHKQLNFQAPGDRIKAFFDRFDIGRLGYRCGMKKTRGVPVLSLLLTIFTLPFAQTNIYRHFTKENTEFQKDALYSLLRSPNISWRRFLLHVAILAIDYLRSLSEERRDSVLIVDDSTLARPRAKKVELCSRVFDHTEGKFLKGFRFLCLGWSDGFSFLPVNFVLLGSQNPQNMVHNAVKVLDPRVSGAKRRKEATAGAPAALLKMLKLAKKYNIKARYVLMDSWFSAPALVSKAAELFPVITMVKKTSKFQYLTESGPLSVNAIHRSLKKRPGKAKWLASSLVQLKGGLNVRLVFVRRRNTKEWLALLSTDTSLPEAEIIRLYGIRWDIEVFFRTVKQHLGFEKGSQGRDYDSLIAHSTIVMLRYIFLSLEQRRISDKRTLGLLFHSCCAEVKSLSFLAALHRILDTIAAQFEGKGMPAEITEPIFQVIIAQVLQQMSFMPIKQDVQYANAG